MTYTVKLHSLDNLKHLYRARRFWHTPQLDEAMEKIITHFGDRESIPTEFIVEFAKHSLPSSEGWQTWYEPCPVVKVTCMEIIVISQDMPEEIGNAYPDFYAGGKFHLNKAKLQRSGCAYHSRHGEYFYLAIPKEAIALATKDIQPCVQ